MGNEMKRREWRIFGVTCAEKGSAAYDMHRNYETKAVELREGEVILSRDEVESIFIGVFGDYENGVETVDVARISVALDELFPVEVGG